MAARSLSELTVEDLDRYAFKAMTTWGEVEDFKHFLPRLFELALTEPDGFNFYEVLFGKLHYGTRSSRLSREQAAMDAFVDELWRVTLKRPVNEEWDESADRALCAFGNARTTMRRFLDAWLSDQGANGTRGLVQESAVSFPK